LKNARIIPGAKVTSVTERRIKQRSSWQQRTPQDDGSPEAIERDCHDIIPYAGFNLLECVDQSRRCGIDLQARNNKAG